MIKVKEMKEDALLEIKVNKAFYLMSKNVSLYLFKQFPEDEKREESLKKIIEGKYEDLNELERSFYTLTLLLAEMEEQAKNNNLYEEKEILQPGDEGYVAPTE
tara:strand:- start:237 stop:545 length:309 start_codon:yes stop_codon:yes gene_type:complete